LNQNPVPLDSAGRAVIFGVGTYRQILENAQGLQVWDKNTTALINPSSSPASSGSGDFLAIGAIIAVAGYTAPTNYVFAYGQAISRTTYVDAFNALVQSISATCSTASTTLVVPNTGLLRTGAPVEAPCLPVGTFITAITSGTNVTLN